MSLTIKDVWSFIKNQPKMANENLLIWLNTFNFYDQLCFIKIITQYKIPSIGSKFIPAVENLHLNCKCMNAYLQLPEPFRKKYPNINVIGKCIHIDTPKTLKVKLVNIVETTKKLTDDKTLTYNNEHYFSTKPFESHLDVNADLFYTQSNNMLQNFLMKNKNNDYDYSMPLYYIMKYPMEELICFINVFELYTLYIIKLVFTMRDFEILIPEYWRSLNRATYNSKKSSPLTILSTIYNFYSGSIILNHNTYTKATFKLAICVEVESFNDLLLSDYIIQPRFSGIRILICKNSSNKLIMRNKNNIKIKLNANLLPKINLDNNNTFTGEFMIMLYNNITDTWLSKKDLIEYLASTIRDPNLTIRLYVLDLLVWNTVNLLSISYEQRLIIIKNFLQNYQHFGLFLMMPDNLTIENITDNFKSYIENGENTRPPFTGILLRKKYVNYNTTLLYTKYKIQKYLMYRRYSIKYLIVEPNKPIVCKKNYTITPLYYNSKFKLTFVCFEIRDSVMRLAIFEDRVYKEFININIGILKFVDITVFSNIKIQINDTEFKGMMVTVGFDKLFDIVDYVIPSPDKSLIDCTTKSMIVAIKSQFI